jgi:hypothetical protein
LEKSLFVSDQFEIVEDVRKLAAFQQEGGVPGMPELGLLAEERLEYHDAASAHRLL